jgi:nucleotide-binding universal stress UspA family protein
MKKILVPTDFSPCSENALHVAIEIAKRAHAQVTLQHLYADSSGAFHTPKHTASGAPANHDEFLALAKSKLDEAVKYAEHKGVDARQLLVMNRGSDKIENYIAPLAIDLVIMGSHGASGIREMIIGSHTQRVVRHAKAPVLVIKHKPRAISIANIMFASTFHDGGPSPALMVPVELASLWHGKIHLLYVGLEKDKRKKKDIEEKMTLLRKQFPAISFTNNFITTNDPEWGIKYAARDIKPDVIALTTQLKTGAFIFTHTLAEHLVNHESLPVLVINA